MSVLCYNCGCSLHWDWALENLAISHRHPVFCKTCAKAYRKGDKKKLKSRSINKNETNNSNRYYQCFQFLK